MRVDWRTGQAMAQHDDAFCRDHEQCRMEQDASMPQYFAAICFINLLLLPELTTHYGRQRQT